jgi:hypothetical protein
MLRTGIFFIGVLSEKSQALFVVKIQRAEESVVRGLYIKKVICPGFSI